MNSTTDAPSTIRVMAACVTNADGTGDSVGVPEPA